MKRTLLIVAAGACLCLWSGGEVNGRGFGGGGGGGFRGGSYGGFSGDRGSFSGERSYGGYSDGRGAAVGGSYDRSWTGDRGGSINVDGSRGAVAGPGGAAAGASRDVTATGPNGRSYSSDRDAGVAVGPYGRSVGGASGERAVSGPNGAAGEAWKGAYGRSTDFGISRYSAAGGVAVGHSTAYWSHSSVVTRAGYVRTGFGYYNCFHPAWYAAHPGCWFAAGWAASAAWSYMPWATFGTYCGFGTEPYDYDYGNTIVYQDNNVYVGGQDAGTPAQYAQQATTIADVGVASMATPDQEWKPMGVFALVQGDDKTSNNVFQLAVNKDGIIRGNFYEGVTDTTTEVYGSVDKKTQRAAWTIGKKKDRVFEAGAWNLTQPEAPCLVHIGSDKTQQWLLVRLDPPADAK